MYNFKFVVALFIFVIFDKLAWSQENELLKYLNSSKEYNYFYKLIKKANYEKLFIEETKFKKILYIPNNEAFESLPLRLQKYIWSDQDNSAAKKIIRTHLYTGSVKQIFKDPHKKVVVIDRFEINGERVKIYGNSDLFVKDIVNKKAVMEKNNITIVPISCVMYLQPSFSDSRLNDKQKRQSIITSCCMLKDQEIDEFIKGDTI